MSVLLQALLLLLRLRSLGCLAIIAEVSKRTGSLLGIVVGVSHNCDL